MSDPTSVNLGTASGRIVIDVTSVGAAVDYVKSASASMKTSMEGMNAAMRQARGRGDATRLRQEETRAASEQAELFGKAAKSAEQAAAAATQRTQAEKTITLAVREQAAATNAVVSATTALLRVEQQRVDAAREMIRLAQQARGGGARALPPGRGGAGGGPSVVDGDFEVVRPGGPRLYDGRYVNEPGGPDVVVGHAQRVAEAVNQVAAANAAAADAAARHAASWGQMVRDARDMGRRNTMRNIWSLEEQHYTQRMPTFISFQFYPLIQLMNALGSQGGAQAMTGAMALTGIVDSMVVFSATTQELGRRLLQGQNALGQFLRMLIGLIPNLSGVQAAFLAVGIVMGGAVAGALAIAAAMNAVAQAQEAGKRAAEQYANAIRQQTDRQRAAQQAMVDETPAESRVTAAEMEAERNRIQRLLANMTDFLKGTESNLAQALASTPGGPLGENVVRLRAQAEATSAEIARIIVEELIPTEEQLRQQMTSVSRAQGIVQFLRQPQEDAQLRRQMLGRSGDDLSRTIQQGQSDIQEYVKQIRSLSNWIDVLRMTGTEESNMLADMLNIERERTLGLQEEAEKTAKAAQGVVQLVYQLEAFDAAVQRQTNLARQMREATVTGVADQLRAIQDERNAILDNLKTLPAGPEGDAKYAEQMARAGELGQQWSDLVTRVLPRAVARAQDTLQTEIQRIQRESGERLAQIQADLAERQAELWADYQQSLTDAQADADRDRQKAADDHADAVAKIEEDSARERERIMRRFNAAAANAIANRDALAYVLAERQRDEDLADLKAQGDARRKELDKQYAEQVKAVDDRLKEQRDTLKRRYDEQVRQAALAADKQVRQEIERANAEIAARRESYRAQFNDLQTALTNEYTLRARAYDSIVKGAQWVADQVNAIMASMTGRQIVVPNAVYVPSGQAYQQAQGAYATGTNRVTRDQIALIHKDEGVMSAFTNRVALAHLGPNYTQSQLASAIAGGAGGNGLVIPITVNGVGRTKRQIVDLVDARLNAALEQAGVAA